jgi:hypothetical protein
MEAGRDTTRGSMSVIFAFYIAEKPPSYWQQQPISGASKEV